MQPVDASGTDTGRFKDSRSLTGPEPYEHLVHPTHRQALLLGLGVFWGNKDSDSAAGTEWKRGTAICFPEAISSAFYRFTLAPLLSHVTGHIVSSVPLP